MGVVNPLAKTSLADETLSKITILGILGVHQLDRYIALSMRKILFFVATSVHYTHATITKMTNDAVVAELGAHTQTRH